MNPFKIATLLAVTALLAGCNTTDRLASIGQAPPLNPIIDPTTVAGYQPVRLPMPEPLPGHLPGQLPLPHLGPRLLQGRARPQGR
jgi:hypothetical protein